MPVIRLKTFIEAPAERCFDVAIDVDVHARSTSWTKERAIAGVTSGRMKLGDTVTWEAIHFGIKQRLTSCISRYERPNMFQDSMVSGAFHCFTHMHEFRQTLGGTLMLDTFSYESPLGPFGILADKLFLKRYMRAFLLERALYLKRVAEQQAHS